MGSSSGKPELCRAMRWTELDLLSMSHPYASATRFTIANPKPVPSSLVEYPVTNVITFRLGNARPSILDVGPTG